MRMTADPAPNLSNVIVVPSFEVTFCNFLTPEFNFPKILHQLWSKSHPWMASSSHRRLTGNGETP